MAVTFLYVPHSLDSIRHAGRTFAFRQCHNLAVTVLYVPYSLGTQVALLGPLPNEKGTTYQIFNTFPCTMAQAKALIWL